MRFWTVCLSILGLFGVMGVTNSALAQTKIYTASTPLEEVERDCGRNIKDACLAAFFRFHEGRGVQADPKRAEWYMLRSCETGEPLACATYSSMIEIKPEGKTSAGQAKVLKYADMACRMGEAQGCERAKRVRAAALPAPAPAPKVASSGTPLLDECNAGNRASCTNYANVLGKQGDNAGALKFSQKACDMGEQAGCLNAKTYANRGAVAKPTQASNVKLKADCDAGNRQACDGYAYTMSQAKNWPEAATYAAKACQMGGKWGCDNQAQMKSAAARVGDQSEEGKQRSRDWQIQNARQTGYYAGAISSQLQGDRHIATVSTLVRDGGAKGLQALTMGELEDLAMNFPSSEAAAYAIIQSEWQRRGGPRILAQREEKRKADQRAWEEEQRARQANSNVPSGRRSNYRPATGAPVGSAGNGSAAPRQQVCTESYTGGSGTMSGQRIVRCR